MRRAFRSKRHAAQLSPEINRRAALFGLMNTKENKKIVSKILIKIIKREEVEAMAHAKTQIARDQVKKELYPQEFSETFSN